MGKFKEKIQQEEMVERETMKKFLKDLEKGKIDEETRMKFKEILKKMDAKTLGLIEQELIEEGIPHETIRKSLCDIHLEVLKDTLVEKRIDVKPPHPVGTLMEEHKIILDNLKNLSLIVEKMEKMESFEDMGDEIENLKEISHHLIEAESHHQREEEALFPMLEKHGITEPPSIMKMDHMEFREKKKKLYQIVHNWNDYDFKTFKKEVIELGKYIARELESHIFKEDNILYQIALQVLIPEEWDEVKKICDKIGYCCFTPPDIGRENKKEV